jgi:hypothetical protein
MIFVKIPRTVFKVLYFEFLLTSGISFTSFGLRQSELN